MPYPYVGVDQFTPNNLDWTSIGDIDSWTGPDANKRFVFKFGDRSLVFDILGPEAFRLRYNPAPNFDYDWEHSVAVQNRDLGLAAAAVTASEANDAVTIETGALSIHLDLKPFSVSVFRGNQLIHQDAPGLGIQYIPGAEVIAVMKSAPTGAYYLGCGEKAGASIFKNQFAFSYFNFDNFSYTSGPSLGTPGPLNPNIPLYCSVPFLLETNYQPSGAFSGSPYVYGLFLDNVGQSFINVSAANFPNMAGRYYLGALYNDLDYYFMAGDELGDVVQQYTTLTGRSTMPPKYVFGLHQGAYGYYDRYKLSAAANSFRANRIPCDGLHIDVDFQDNYRTFTHSNLKFPNVKEMFDDLHGIGFKMSTNITPVLTSNPLDETGKVASFDQMETLCKAGALIKDNRQNIPNPDDELYLGGVNYGVNHGSNPYPYPPRQFNRNGEMPLSARGYYPEFGRQAVRELWGEQYKQLLDLGLDMIWQDMTCPAIDRNLPPDIEQYQTFVQDLMVDQEVFGPGGEVQIQTLPQAKVHNAYALNLLRATSEGIDKLRPNDRNFIIARGGYAGMQRYAGLWTGDSASSWDFLQINIPEVLNLGLSGIPISGCDIGGFAVGSGTTTSSSVIGGEVVGGITNYELLTRWMQLGSFLPWYRNHYDGYNKQFQEPYAYGEPVPLNCRKYVELRYRMIQIYYDAMYRWTQTGTPIARPLFWDAQTDPQAYAHSSDQLLVGDDFLVAPVITQHDTASPPSSPVRDVYLPAGSNWYAFMDNTQPIVAAIMGGSLVSNYYAPLDTVPIYVRAGAILPFSELEQWVGQFPENPLTFNCYPGPDRWSEDTAYQLYQDDGISTNSSFRLSRVYQQTLYAEGVTRQVRVERVEGSFTPPAKFYYVAIIGSLTPPDTVLRDGVSLSNVDDPTGLSKSTMDAYYWNENIQIAFAKIFDDRADTTISFEY